ncbi:unnamed protein product, partial [marine sediment metagenome]
MKALKRTRRKEAASTADCWMEQYYQNGAWEDCLDSGSERVYEELLALGAFPEPEHVNKVIGNDSWVDLKCDGCGGRGLEEVV